MPVGMCVILTLDAVLFIFCPPLPEPCRRSRGTRRPGPEEADAPRTNCSWMSEAKIPSFFQERQGATGGTLLTSILLAKSDTLASEMLPHTLRLTLYPPTASSTPDSSFFFCGWDLLAATSSTSRYRSERLAGLSAYRVELSLVSWTLLGLDDWRQMMRRKVGTASELER